jgi:hypothetical protein
MNSANEYLTVEQLAQRLGWTAKTVHNKMGRVFIRGVHFDSPPGMPTLFRWSAVLSLYRWNDAPTPVEAEIPMARGYSMK